MLDIGTDGRHQFVYAVDGEALELALREFAEEALDQIEPRHGGRDEVEVDPRMPLKPGPYAGMLVGGVVVQDEVEVKIRIGRALDFA